MLEDRLDLLRRLTAATPDWALVKGERSALEGTGDIDSAAPAGRWPALLQAARDWSDDTGRGPVLVCRHIPGALILAVLEHGRPPTLVQIDVLDARLLRGTPIVHARDFVQGSLMAPGGYRRARPAAEALARLVLDEWPLLHTPDEADRRRIASLLRDDPEGSRALAATLDPRLAGALRTLERERWPRAALMMLELDALARVFQQPQALLRRLAAAPQRLRCPLLRALRDERRVTGDLDAWLVAVTHAHQDVGCPAAIDEP
jgi:hypothetical protein